jgi:hypothetical protein
MLEHGVEDGKELAHASYQGHLLRLTQGQKAMVEGLKNRIMAHAHQSGHVKGGPNMRTTTTDRTLAPMGATVTVERGHTNKLSHLLAAQGAQFRQVGDEGEGQGIADARDASEQVLLLLPEGARAEEFFQISLHKSNLLREPVDMTLDVLAHPFGSPAHTILLHGAHLDELTASRYQGREGLRVFIREGTGFQGYPLGKEGQDVGVNSIGLGELSCSLGEVPDLPWIYHPDNEAGLGQGSHQKGLKASCRFHQDELGSNGEKPVYKEREAGFIMRGLPALPGGQHSDVQGVLGDVDTHEGWNRHDLYPRPILAVYAGFRPYQPFGLARSQAGRPC